MSFLKNGRVYIALAVIVLLAVSSFKFLNDKMVLGFQHPESAFFIDGYIYVSNIGLTFDGRKLDGFISKLDRYGNILEYKYLDNLKAPKGVYAYHNMLYVADLNRVCVFNLDTKNRRCINIKGSKFLNDIIFLYGSIYVTDTLNNAVYMVNQDNVTVFYKQDGLSPNGIAFSKKLNAILVVSFDKPQITLISLNGEKLKSFELREFSGFDGISIDNNRIYISDYKTGRVIACSLDFKHIKVIKQFDSPVADIFVKNSRLLAPLIEKNSLYIGEFK